MDSGKDRRGAKALSISCYGVTDLPRISQNSGSVNVEFDSTGYQPGGHERGRNK
jgi:hypothetical protein